AHAGPRGAIGPAVLPAVRALPHLLRVPAATRVLLVDRRLRAEHRDRKPVPAAGRLHPLLPDLSAPEAAPFRETRRLDGRASGGVEAKDPGLPLRQSGPSV